MSIRGPGGRTPTARKTNSGRAAGRRGSEPSKPDSRGVGRRRARVALVLGVSVVFVGFLFAFYFPTRTWLTQRHNTANATRELDGLTNANRELAAQAKALKDPAVVTRLARAQYGMVKPGEQAFVVLPSPTGATALPKIWPFEQSVTPVGPNATQGQISAGASQGPSGTG